MNRTQYSSAAVAVLMAASLAACGPTKPAATPAAVDTAKIATDIKADMADLVAAYNAHDADKSSAHNATDVVQMFHGGPNITGAAAALEENKKQAAADPTFHVTLANEVVDVASAGDMAVYRSSYVVSFTDPKTKKPGAESGNYLAGYKKQADGSWKIAWSVVSDTPAAGGGQGNPQPQSMVTKPTT